MKFIRILLMMSLLLFVNAGAATISGYAYCDLDDDGVKDSNETCTQEAVWAKMIKPDGQVSVTKALYDEDLNISGYYIFDTHGKTGTYRVILDNNSDGKDTVATPPPNAHFTSDPVDGDDGNSSNGQAIYNIDGTTNFTNQNYGMQFGGDCVCEDADGTVFKKTILVDGNISDWSDVYTDPDNNICDYGCALDKDATVQSTGRNLVQFTWTGDDLFAYGYTFRVGSSSNTQTFIYYADRDGDGKMGDGKDGLPDFAIVGRWQGTKGTTSFYFYPYIPADPAGDSMVWTQADIDAGKEAPGGKVPDSSWIGSGDGYTLAGTLDTDNKVEITGTDGHAQGVTVTTGGLDDAGVKMEWRVRWSFLKLVPFQHITYHISASNTTINSSHPPSGIDDNMAGCYGEAVIRYCGVKLSPDHSVILSVTEADAIDYVYFEHNLTNTGNNDDNLTLEWNKISGDFDPVSVTFYNDKNGDGNETTGAGEPIVLTSPVAIGLGESINLLVKVELPLGLDNNTTVLEINATTTTCDINFSAIVTDTITVLPQNFDLGVIKKVNGVDAIVADEGEPVVYTIEITNNGPDEALNVAVSDTLPGDVNYGGNYVATKGTYNSGLWTIGDMADGDIETLTIDVNVSDTAGEGTIIQNIACTTDTNDTDSNDCDDANITAHHIPIVNLQITKIVSDDKPHETDDINYTITVTNFSLDTAASVNVHDVLPAYVTYAGDYNSSTGPGTFDGTDWTIGDMLYGAAETLIITVNVDTNATANNDHINEACVSTTTIGTNLKNDCAYATFIASNEVDVGVVKTVDTLYPGEGDTIVYTINVTNNGPITVTSLVLNESTIDWANITSEIVSLGTYSAPDWTIPELNVSQTATLTITGTVNNGTAGNSYTNTIYIDSLDQNDTNGTNDNDYAVIIVENPSIDIEKYTNGVDVMAAPGPDIFTGAEVTWDYNVTNTGDVNLTNITVTDINSTGGSVTVTCPTTPTILIPGASILCTASDTAINGQYDNNATVTGTSPAGHDVNDSDMSWYFGTYAPASIGDFAWYDDNDNGVQDSGEVPVNGLTVELFDASGSPLATTTTDSAGYYSFDDLASGTYSVVFSGLTSEYVFSAKQHDSVANSDGSTDPIILTGIDIDTIDVGLYCITPTEDSSSSGGDAMGNISAALMVLMTLMIGLFFVRREEQLNRNKI